MKLVYSNAPSLLPLLPFRVSSLLWAYPTPSATCGQHILLGSPTFMRYLPLARNPILPRRVQTVHIIVSSGLMAGFVNSDRLATLIGVTRLKGQLTQVFALNLMQFVSLLHLRVTSTRTTNLIAWFFHPCRYLIYIYARFVAYLRFTEPACRQAGMH